MNIRFEIFPADLTATADFYERVLRFRLVRDERDAPQRYLALERDGVRIGAAQRAHVVDRDHRQPPVGVEIVLEVDDVEDERAWIMASGWSLAEDLAAQPWGLRDFRLLDPSGYYLRITEPAN